MNKVELPGPETLLSPDTQTPLTEIQAGGELNAWVADVMGVDVFSYSESWQSAGKLLEKLAEDKEKYFALTWLRHDRTQTYEFRRNPRIIDPATRFQEMWFLSVSGPLEGQYFCEDSNPLVALCRGLIWYKERSRHVAATVAGVAIESSRKMLKELEERQAKWGDDEELDS